MDKCHGRINFFSTVGKIFQFGVGLYFSLVILDLQFSWNMAEHPYGSTPHSYALRIGPKRKPLHAKLPEIQTLKIGENRGGEWLPSSTLLSVSIWKL